MGRLFGTSGVRRKVDELTDEFAENLGRAVGSCVKTGVAVGRDTRHSGPRLEAAFVRGLVSCGTDVVRLGVVPTPTVGVACPDVGAGVVVTASHNPPDYNGFKLFGRGGAFKPSEEDRVEGAFRSGRFKSGAGSVRDEDYVARHVKLIRRKVKDAQGVKVFLDCAGGAGSAVTPGLLRQMRCDVTSINEGRDGVFPHPLEPTAENLAETCELVRRSGADIGFAHDGDADRACAIGADGRLIEWDTFLTVLASQSDKAVTTVDASMRIEEYCRRVYRVAVGDVAVAEGIRKHKAGFGGEPSGTYIFPDIHIFPDGVATIAKAAKLVADGVFYDLVNEIPTYPMERVKIPCPNAEKDKVMEGVRKALRGREYSDIDGLRIEEEYGWMLIRPSGTEEYVRITAEAKTRERLEELVKAGKGWIRSAR
jgi:phosphoglucosamine mutase